LNTIVDPGFASAIVDHDIHEKLLDNSGEIKKTALGTTFWQAM